MAAHGNDLTESTSEMETSRNGVEEEGKTLSKDPSEDESGMRGSEEKHLN